jgi:hypothetical protein
MLKNNINFQYHINHILRLVFLEKAHLSCMVSDKVAFYIKLIVFDKIYNF